MSKKRSADSKFETEQTFYTEALKLGVPMDIYNGDIYVPFNKEMADLAKKYSLHHAPLQSTKDGKMWMQVKFAYDPYYTPNGYEAKWLKKHEPRTFAPKLLKDS